MGFASSSGEPQHMATIADVTRGLGAVGLAVTLAACSSGSAGLSTGALFGGGDKTAAAPAAAPPPPTPDDRAVHVGATSARATRCGYVFDPANVRSAYLAYEAGLGGAPDQLARTEKSYDYTVASIGKTISANADYCSDEQTSVIKKDLAKVLAGDFSAPPKKASSATDSWWGGSTSPKKFNRDDAFKTKDSI